MAASLLKDLLLLWITNRSAEIDVLIGFLSIRSGVDSWAPIYASVEYLRSGATGLYQSIFFDQRIKFQYPPTSLLPFLGLSYFGFDRVDTYALMSVTSFACVLGIWAISVGVCFQQLGLPALRDFAAHRGARLLVIVAVAAGTFTFFPIMYGFSLGQIQIMINLAVAVALLAWLRNRKTTAGALFALVALTKPHFALLLVWALLRGEREFVRGFLVAALPVALLSVAVFGIEVHLEYLSVVSHLGSHGESYWANQSVNGLLNRFFAGAESLSWDPNAFPKFNPVVYGGTLLSSVVFLLFALAFRPAWTRRAHPTKGYATGRQESLFDLSTMIVAVTIASPVAWEHHYGVMWPIILAAFLALTDLNTRRTDRLIRWSLLGLACSYLLVSNFFTQLRLLADTPFNVLQSYFLFGGLALLGTLVALRVGLGPDVQRGDPDGDPLEGG